VRKTNAFFLPIVARQLPLRDSFRLPIVARQLPLRDSFRLPIVARQLPLRDSNLQPRSRLPPRQLRVTFESASQAGQFRAA
jgi:hypothetical protein